MFFRKARQDTKMAYEITFHGNLGYFFKPDDGKDTKFVMERLAPMKDIVEAIGIPHTEVGRIISEGNELGFTYIPQSHDSIDIYPIEPPDDVSVPTVLRPKSYPSVRFIADVNVGKLAKLMRLLGFDTAYGNCWEDSYITDRALKESRIVLTKDRNLLKRRIVAAGRLVRTEKPWDQAAEVMLFYGLQDAISPFGICPMCNGKLEKVEKARILDRIEPLTRLFVDEFRQCPECGRIYWSGTHRKDILERIGKLKKG